MELLVKAQQGTPLTIDPLIQVWTAECVLYYICFLDEIKEVMAFIQTLFKQKFLKLCSIQGISKFYCIILFGTKPKIGSLDVATIMI